MHSGLRVSFRAAQPHDQHVEDDPLLEKAERDVLYHAVPAVGHRKGDPINQQDVYLLRGEDKQARVPSREEQEHWKDNPLSGQGYGRHN